MPMPCCVAFDIDGCLVDTDAVHEQALNAALSDIAGFTLTHAEHLATWKGRPTRDKLAALIQAGRLEPCQANKVLERKQAYTADALDTLPHDPRPRALLLKLRHAGYRIAAVSNAQPESVRRMLQKAHVGTLLEFALSNEDAAPKPAPDLYLLAARRFGVSPDELVVVEDGAPGIVAATRARCTVVAVDGPQDVTPSLLPRIVLAGLRAAILPGVVVA